MDVSRAEAQLNATLAIIPPLETAIARASHRLGVLIGQQPTILVTTLSAPLPLPGLPTLIALGKPEDLLRRRPDIRIAERNLAAATARVGVATADLFPRITVLGSIGVEAGSLRGFGQGGIETFRWVRASFGLRLTWDGCGRASGPPMPAPKPPWRNMNSACCWPWRKPKTPWSISSASRPAVICSVLRPRPARKPSGLARLRYQFGVSDFLTVLDAERTRLIAQDLLADSETRTALTLIAVYKALGGGWEYRG